MKNLNQLKNSTLLKELKRRMKLKEIRFNYTYCQNCGDNPDGLISWNALDAYELDFAEITKLELTEQANWLRKQGHQVIIKENILQIIN
jgi:hypothetical protein